MILGIGTDIIEIQRLGKALKKSPKMVERIFTLDEIAHAKKLSPQKRLAFYAKRFSGKEAISKACGTGIGKNLSWHDMSILNDHLGAPVITLSPNALKFLKKKFKSKTIKAFVSLSDEKDFAIAFCVLTK